MVTIVDYGMGNVGSIVNMLKKVGASSVVASGAEEIGKATKLILPGVGAFDTAMRKIEESGLRSILDKKALEEKIPVLGICLGMQLLTKGSDEGELQGLGWIPAYTNRIPQCENIKIPHMGWNIVRPSTPCQLTSGFEDEESRFYFVHSYAVAVEDQNDSMFKSHHGIDFDSGIKRGNIFGVQFHPEKSHRFGKKLFANFIGLS